MITLLIIDENSFLRMGIRTALQKEDGIEVIGDCGPGEEALSTVERLRPDIVLLGLRRPIQDAFAVCHEIRERVPTTRVLIMSHQNGVEEVLVSVVAGASGHLVRDVEGPTLVRAIGIAMSGGSYFDWNAVQRVIDRVQRPPVDGSDGETTFLATLSARERAVLTLVAQGLTNREIGERLKISANTARSHVSRILAKLKLTRRSQAATLAALNGLVDESCAPE